MKKIIIIAAILFSANFIMAQTSTAPSKQVLKELEILKNSELYLTDVQIGRITTVLSGEEYNTTRVLKSVEGNKSLTELKLKEIKEHKLNNIKGAMTPQQVEKFNKLNLEDKF